MRTIGADIFFLFGMTPHFLISSGLSAQAQCSSTASTTRPESCINKMSNPPGCPPAKPQTLAIVAAKIELFVAQHRQHCELTAFAYLVFTIFHNYVLPRNRYTFLPGEIIRSNFRAQFLGSAPFSSAGLASARYSAARGIDVCR
ncbi:MAG: hypothetical protein P4L91_10560 [Burkholderiaceae bacterium]|nr:hypothetical protein [Burkholderiaceae bacterium]